VTRLAAVAMKRGKEKMMTTTTTPVWL